ncbi:MAG: MFS transporter [Nocardiopsaceae bacterium]|nr:MFS transporter [Nocardiopsaceae bacterium]
MGKISDPRMKTRARRSHLGLRGWAFRLLIIATATSFSSYVLLLPLVPLWATRGGAGEFGAGATTSVFMLTTVLTQLVMPWLLDHGGYRWTFAVGSLLLGLPAPLFILTTDLGGLIAISGVRGIGFGMVTVVGSALAARLVLPEQIGRAAAYYGFSVGVPIMVFLSTGVGMALSVGFVVVFWIAAIGPVIGAVAAVGVWLTGGDGSGAQQPGASGAPMAPKGGTPPTGLRLYAALTAPLVIMLALAIASSAVVTFLAIPLERVPWIVSVALLLYGALSVVGRWIAGMLSDRYGRPVLLVPSVACAVLGMGLATWMIWPADAGWSGPGAVGAVLIITGVALFGAGFGMVQNDTIILMFHRSGPAGYGTASAVWNIGYDAGTGVGALSLGIVIQYLGYGPAFAMTGLTIALCLPTAVALSRQAA